MMRKRASLGLVLALITFISFQKPAYANIRWFLEKGEHPGEHFSMDLTSLLVIFGAILFAVVAFTIDRVRWSQYIRAISEKTYLLFPQGNEWRIIASLSGILLIVNSITGVFLAPNLVLPSEGLVILGKTVQVAIGLMLVSQMSFLFPGLLILFVAILLAAIYLPVSLPIDYIFEFVALGLALVFIGISACYLDQVACRLTKRDPERFANYPIPLIRVGVGLNFVVLAIHNKPVNPTWR